MKAPPPPAVASPARPKDGGRRLVCHDLTFRYPGGEKPVLRELDFEIPEAGFHALFGPSGVGKTSLARILAGLIAPRSGRVELPAAGRALYTFNTERLPDWSGVGTHLQRVTPPRREALREELVAAFGLNDLMDQRFSQLSLGQQNRVNLVRYLLQDFDLLIMDESLANVDEARRATIISRIKEMYPGALFLYISHNVLEVARYCRWIVVCREAANSPQAVRVAGMDSAGTAPAPRGLETVMLEIMNAG